MLRNTKAASIWQLAFSILFLSILASCSDPNSIGSGFIDESEIILDTVYVTELPIESVEPYTGILTYSPIGEYDDPLFGNISSYAIFKPQLINGAEDSTFTENATTKLELHIDTAYTYGSIIDDVAFNIYRVQELWRGTAVKMGDNVPYADEVIGSFNYSEIDSAGFLEVELGGSWKADYMELYQDTTDSRDSVYKYLDYGLAIVPEPDANQIVYARFSTSGLFIFDHEIDDDTTVNFMQDWAYQLEVSGEDIPENHLSLTNTYDTFLNYDLTPVVEAMENPNFVRVEFVMTSDSNLVEGSIGADEIRTELPNLGLQLGPSYDLAYELGFNDLSAFAIIDAGVYHFDLTDVVSAYLYGDTNIEEVYFYAAQNSGVLGFNAFYGVNAEQHNVPKFVFYYLVD